MSTFVRKSSALLSVTLFGILLFGYHHGVKPAAHGAKKVAHAAYKAAV